MYLKEQGVPARKFVGTLRVVTFRGLKVFQHINIFLQQGIAKMLRTSSNKCFVQYHFGNSCARAAAQQNSGNTVVLHTLEVI